LNYFPLIDQFRAFINPIEVATEAILGIADEIKEYGFFEEYRSDKRNLFYTQLERLATMLGKDKISKGRYAISNDQGESQQNMEILAVFYEKI
jgi:hypothetical protein